MLELARPRGPTPDDMLIILPYLRSSIRGRTAFVQINTALRLRLISGSHSASVLSIKGFGGVEAPALLTKISILPNFARAAVTALLTSALLATSAREARALRPKPSISAAVF